MSNPLRKIDPVRKQQSRSTWKRGPQRTFRLNDTKVPTSWIVRNLGKWLLPVKYILPGNVIYKILTPTTIVDAELTVDMEFAVAGMRAAQHDLSSGHNYWPGPDQEVRFLDPQTIAPDWVTDEWHYEAVQSPPVYIASEPEALRYVEKINDMMTDLVEDIAFTNRMFVAATLGQTEGTLQVSFDIRDRLLAGTPFIAQDYWLSGQAPAYDPWAAHLESIAHWDRFWSDQEALQAQGAAEFQQEYYAEQAANAEALALRSSASNEAEKADQRLKLARARQQRYAITQQANKDVKVRGKSSRTVFNLMTRGLQLWEQGGDMVDIASIFAASVKDDQGNSAFAYALGILDRNDIHMLEKVSLLMSLGSKKWDYFDHRTFLKGLITFAVYENLGKVGPRPTEHFMPDQWHKPYLSI